MTEKMVLLYGSLQLGFLYGLLAMGIFISFRILNIPDLTAEGSFTFGLAVSAAFTVAGHPILGIFMAIFAGAFAGILTGVLQTKLMIHPVLAGILTMGGLYTVNLGVMGNSSNLSLIGSDTIFKIVYTNLTGGNRDLGRILLAVFAAGAVFGILIFFFQTQLGLCIRATGDNEDMVRASSINVDATKIIALAVSNACTALSGGLIAQYQGFADISSGVGILVVGLASVIIGEVILGKRGVIIGLLSAIVGAVIYRFIIAFAMQSNWFPASALKLVSACIVAAALSLPALRYYMEVAKIKKGAQKHVRDN